MAKKVVAINASPRTGWNTAQIVRAAAEGARDTGAEVEYFDLYKLDPYQGCRSCFACKTERSRGICPIKDGLAPVLQSIREADALIVGTPNYFGRPTAGFRALLERLCFQYLTYRSDEMSYNKRRTPVLYMMTSNASEEQYSNIGYDAMIDEQVRLLERFIGPVSTHCCTNTLQTDHYELYEWTVFDVEEKQRRHKEVFPQELETIRIKGRQLLG